MNRMKTVMKLGCNSYENFMKSRNRHKTDMKPTCTNECF
jgi:hypothetical protein